VRRLPAIQARAGAESICTWSRPGANQIGERVVDHLRDAAMANAAVTGAKLVRELAFDVAPPFAHADLE
jgi:hypothetical protein